MRIKRLFTLAECMIALGVTLIVLVSASELLSINLYSIRTLDDRRACTDIAKNRIEALRSLTFADLQLAEELNIQVNEQGVPDTQRRFLRTTAISDPYYSSSIVLVRAKNIAKYRVYPILIDVTTILMDQNLITYGN